MTDRLVTALLIAITVLGTTSCRSNASSRATPIQATQAGEAGRQHILMDPGWRFQLGDVNDGQAVAFNDKAWRMVDLPHDWSIEGGFDPNYPMSAAGGYLPAGVGWYRRAFITPDAWNGKRVTIEFEGVYMNADVWLNGQHLGFHPYGYTGFRYDVTSQLKPGAVNTLAVKVDNSKQRNSRWYSGSGIYRHVWLTVTDPVHLAPWGVFVTTPDANAAKAWVQVQTRIQNDSDAERTCTLRTTLLDPNGSSAGVAKTETSVPAHDEKVITTAISVASPKLWSPDAPSLYRAVSAIHAGDKAVDEVRTTFGIRTLRISAEKGFELNGQTLKLCGGCVHHDNGCLGAAAFDRAEERRVELLKAAGFNAIRTSHNPPSTAFLDACDRLGMIVMDEAFDAWAKTKNKFDYGISFKEWWPSDIEAMVLRDRNHPSVVFWSLGNEIPERASPDGTRTSKMLADYVRSLDGTRFITSALNGARKWSDLDPTFATLDVAGYNYAMANTAADHERVPSRVIVCTESFPKAAFESWTYCHDKSYVIGDFVWTALDYIGEAAIGRYAYSTDTNAGNRSFGGGTKQLYPWHNAWCGDLDLMGGRKAISHYRNVIWDRGEKLYVGVREPQTESRTIRLGNDWSVWPTWESWTWPGFEGKSLDVEVYSSSDKVQLYLNDKLIGEKPTTRAESFTATFSVPYAPGKLRAVVVQGDKKIAENILTTAGDAARIRLVPDRAAVSAGGQDLSFVTVEVTDKAGQLQPNAEHPIHFSVTGAGVIAGVDNGSDRSEERYQADQRKALHGRALVVIRSQQQPGQIKLTAASPGLESATVTIQSRPAAQ
jgi:beta-galactosidase